MNMFQQINEDIREDKEDGEEIFIEKQIIPVAHPTKNQAAVMAKIAAAPTPELAAAEISDTPNLAAARDMLIKLNMIDMSTEGAFLTDKGKDVMVNQNLMTPDGTLTDDGQRAAYGEEAANAAPAPDTSTEPPMQEPTGEDELNLDLEMEGYELLNNLSESATFNAAMEVLEKVPDDLLDSLSREEQLRLSEWLNGKIEIAEPEVESVREKLFNYYVGQMPYGVAKGRTEDPFDWILNKILDGIGREIDDTPEKDPFF